MVAWDESRLVFAPAGSVPSLVSEEPCCEMTWLIVMCWGSKLMLVWRMLTFVASGVTTMCLIDLSLLAGLALILLWPAIE
jgi:hypothetical protein